MASNEPGKNQKPDTPPDLDEVLKDLQKKIRTIFGRKKISLNGTNASPRVPDDEKLSMGALYIFIFLVLLAVWIISGFFIVDPPEKAAVLRFGKFINIDDPGLHWIPPFIDDKIIVNVQQVLTYPLQAEMLTEDENIVSVNVIVQYRIADLRNYLFNVANPNESLRQATASALRQVIGQEKLDEVLTAGRDKVAQETKDVLEETLDRYHAGLLVTNVNLQQVKPPEEVTDAFDDAIKAREDEQRYKNQAITYANRVVPIANGNAARITAEAEAYQQKVVLNARGNTAEFLALLPEYLQAPAVTRERMYLDTIQNVLSHSSKVILDTPDSNNMMYVPLDKIMNNAATKTSKQAVENTQTNLLPLKQVTPQNTSQGLNNRPSYNSSSSYNSSQSQGD